MPAERPGQLEEVRVVERAPDRLPQLVLGDRVQAAVGRVGRVVAVDHLAEEPRVRVRVPDDRQHLGPEAGRHRVRGVEPPSRRAPVQPVGHDLRDVVDEPRAPRGPGRRAADGPRTWRTRRPRRRTGTTGRRANRGRRQRGLERRERAADVVEHPVQDDTQATTASLGHEVVEVVLVAEPGIDLEVVDGVVAMGLGGEDRAEQQARTAELDRIVQPALQLPQPVPDGLLLRQLRLLRTGEAERVHVPPDSVIGP